jgi:hypothetical protein
MRHYIYWAVGGGGFPNKEKRAGLGHGEFGRFTILASFLSDRAKDIQEWL